MERIVWRSIIRKFMVSSIACLFLFPAAPAAATPVPPLKGKIIVVDPGHGGYDPGAVRGGVYEKHINLQIALKLKKSLEEKGAAVILTHDGDYNLAIPGLHAREAHRYDLGKRLEIADKSKADLFASIHVNCINAISCKGAEAFYNPGSKTGKLLAECIQAEMRSVPGMEKRTAKTRDCYVLSNARIPAVLVEVGYLSNPDERKKLLDGNYQAMLADKISRGIERFFAMETSG
ncbi:MAG: N-acetylmuramoyl-L-alanine amidase [Peptococcaceae bacterium]|nr:N-acetylmuramoyl-L-alanine amidase [Peptococcaceae bacterium]